MRSHSEQDTSITSEAATSASDSTPKQCLHCDDRPARVGYEYCGPCTVEAHQTSRQAALRNHLTQPPIKVYRWDTTDKRWSLKGTEEVVEP